MEFNGMLGGLFPVLEVFLSELYECFETILVIKGLEFRVLLMVYVRSIGFSLSLQMWLYLI